MFKSEFTVTGYTSVSNSSGTRKFSFVLLFSLGYFADCKTVVISGGSYASCEGIYELTSDTVNGSPVYHNTNNRALSLVFTGNWRWACSEIVNGVIANYYPSYSSKYSSIQNCLKSHFSNYNEGFWPKIQNILYPVWSIGSCLARYTLTIVQPNTSLYAHFGPKYLGITMSTYIFNILGNGFADYPWLAEWNGGIKVKCQG